MPEGKRLLSRREVAAIFGVSPHTVYRWAREGRLPSVMTLGGRRRYPAEEIYRLAQLQPDGSGGVGNPGGKR
ncbi:MAG TPA: helix-turn-helix domain-containing protein [bacterium]|nr:helix-turn-helix domain-containing protein [bacterium]